MAKQVRVRVPATTANLGPGFDCLGMALNIHNEIEFTSADEGPPLSIEVSNEDAGSIPLDERNLVYRAASVVFSAAGEVPASLKITLRIQAPLARGLGSSASAIVGGMAAANALLRNPLPEERLLLEIVKMEGHPDNVVACYYGGLTAALMADDQVFYQKWVPARSVRCVLVIPEYSLSTAKARQAIPKTISHRDAVFNLARVPFVISGLSAGDFGMLRSVMEDRLHQPFRKELIRCYDELVARGMDAGASAVCLSGAGPTMLMIAEEGVAAAVAQAGHDVLQNAGIGSRVPIVMPDLEGCKVVS